MSSRITQMTCAGGVASSDGAFLEVPLEDVGAGEGVIAEHTHVGTVTSVCTR